MTRDDQQKTADALLHQLTDVRAEPPRLLLVFAHPDDESLAVGGRLARLGLSRLLTMTDGSPENGDDARHHGFADLAAYRVARRQELLQALHQAGLRMEFAPESERTVADQTAAEHLGALVETVAAAIAEFQPEAVMTHPYEGGHPDHDACAFAVHEALRRRRLGQPTVPGIPIFEAPFYHAGPDGRMITGVFPEAPGSSASTTADTVVTAVLTPEQRERKEAALACFRSQRETLKQFATDKEQYRVAPAYDFTERPHAGQLFYERFPWGMDGDRFCRLAREARGRAAEDQGAANGSEAIGRDTAQR